MSTLNSSSRREALDPISNENRIFGISTYIPFWISSMVVIQTFVVGQTYVPPNGVLNTYQAVVASIVAGIIIAIMFVVNAQPGMKYGIPFIVQTRSSFGYIGARYAALIRVLPAVFWFGIGSWIGATGISYITETFWGWSNSMLYFILFMIVQTVLVYFGIETAKWFNTFLSIIVFAFMIYVNVKLFSVGGEKLQTTWDTVGSWGIPFFAAVSTGVGTLITGAINISDISRYLKNSVVNNVAGNFIGIFPFHTLMILTGILAAAVTGIWDPIQALVSVMTNDIIALLLVVFIVASQITTNITLNIIPPAMQLVETFNLKWGISTIIVGILGSFSFPWILLSSNVFDKFIGFYSAFLGPLLGILIADYYIVRKRDYHVKNLYKDTIKYNWIGISSLIIGGIFGLIFIELSWMVSLPISAVLYLIGNKLIPKYKTENILDRSAI